MGRRGGFMASLPEIGPSWSRGILPNGSVIPWPGPVSQIGSALFAVAPKSASLLLRKPVHGRCRADPICHTPRVVNSRKVTSLFHKRRFTLNGAAVSLPSGRELSVTLSRSLPLPIGADSGLSFPGRAAVASVSRPEATRAVARPLRRPWEPSGRPDDPGAPKVSVHAIIDNGNLDIPHLT
jgi:hypothetical protein